ncbi:MAG: hypothetical protein AAF655_03335, partial [Bacteroidota bacterium]
LLFGAFGTIAILGTVFAFSYKMQKAKLEAENGGASNTAEILKELKRLSSNQSRMLKRIESLEAIIVDNDMNDLETGLSSKMEEKEDASNSTATTLDKDINL